VTLNILKMTLTYDPDMQICLKMFSNLCNCRAESRYLRQFQLITQTHAHFY